MRREGENVKEVFKYCSTVILYYKRTSDFSERTMHDSAIISSDLNSWCTFKMEGVHPQRNLNILNSSFSPHNYFYI